MSKTKKLLDNWDGFYQLSDVYYGQEYKEDSAQKFEVGDEVWITKDCEYAGKYKATPVKIKRKANYGYDVEAADGQEFSIPGDYLEITPKDKAPELTNMQRKCKHEKKYINRISATVAFWACPDCKADLGDA